MPSNRAVAYSYLRFSSPEQRQGDSLRRQLEAAQAYAERNGLDLDTTLTFHDLGISAFRGNNVKNGALGAFLKAIEDGIAKPNSYLLVESLDRVTRQSPWDALPIFQQIINAGVSIVTLQDGRIYSQEEIRENPFRIMESLLVMIRANEESDIKSRRMVAAWANKKKNASENGHKLTSMCPAWLRLEDGRFVVIEERAAVIRRIFELTLAGYGYVGIAKRFNEEGVEPFHVPNRKQSNGWHHSYLVKILNNPAVIGRFQPMRRQEDGSKVPDGGVIENYFPPIIDEATFYQVKRGKPGVSPTKGTFSNVLSGLVHCSGCGGRMHFISKGPLPKGGTYLSCDNARRKRTCSAKSVRYSSVLNLVLYSLSEEDIDVASLVNHSKQPTMREQLQGHKDRLEAQIAETKDGIDNLLDVLTRVPSASVEDRLAKLDGKLKRLTALLNVVHEQLLQATNGEDDHKDAKEAIEEFNKRRGEEGIRVRLNAALKKVIRRIDVGSEDEYTYSRTYDERGEIDDKPHVVVNISFRNTERQLVMYTLPASAKPLRTFITLEQKEGASPEGQPRTAQDQGALLAKPSDFP